MIALTLLLFACLYIPVTDLDARLDPDGDGSPWPQDCAPDDSEVSPLEAERCGDAIDNDCDGSPGACAAQDATWAWARWDGVGDAEGWGRQVVEGVP